MDKARSSQVIKISMTWLRQVATYSYQWPLKAVMNQQTQVNKIWEYREPPAAIGKHEVL